MKKLIFLFLLLAYLSGLYSLTLNLKRVAKIRDEKITVADITESFEGSRNDFLKIHQIVVAELPYEKRIVNIQSRLVLQRVKLFNPEIDIVVPQTITAVRWDEQDLCSNILQENVNSYLRNYYSLSEKAVISLITVPKIQVPSQDVVFNFKHNYNSGNTKYIRLDANISYNEKTINVFNLIIDVQDYMNVYKSNKSIRRGDKINPNDFIVVSKLVSPNSNYLRFLDDSKELIAHNMIPRGAYLLSNSVVESPFVQRNDLVTVLIKSMSVQLTYQALARSNGWLGDRIMLQNPDTRETFYAEVIEKNMVLINLED